MSGLQGTTGRLLSQKTPSTYRTIGLPLGRLGFAPIPCRSAGDKAPAESFGKLTELSESAWQKRVQAWDSPHPSALWLLDALAGSSSPDLDVLDYDDMKDVDFGVEKFGRTPLTQKTGREGGGEHHFYRRDTTRPRNEHGSVVKFIPGKAIDWKSWHGYVVAPGSLHKSGRTYQLYWNGNPISADDLTPDMLNALPVLDRNTADEVVAAAAAQASAPVNLTEFSLMDSDPFQGSAPRGQGAWGPGGKLPRVGPKPVNAVIPAGRWKGMTVEEVAKRSGPGSVKVACPHADDGKPHKSDMDFGGSNSARLHVDTDDTAAFMTCFACGRVYTYGGKKKPEPPKPPTPGEGITRVHITPEHLTSTGHLSLDAIVRRTEGRQTMVLQLGRGLGKTTTTAQIVKALQRKRPDLWTVAVSPTRSLTEALSTVMNLPHYEATDAHSIKTPIAVCLPSLPRVAPVRLTFDSAGEIVDEGTPDILVVEEVEQQVRTLMGSHLDEWQSSRAWRALVDQVARATMIIMLDADAGTLTELLLREAGRTNDTTWFYGAGERPRPFMYYKKRKQWHAALKATIERGERPYIYTQSKAEAEALHQLYPGLILVTGGTDGTVRNYDLGKINEWAVKGQGLVTTPCLGTGVSIDPVHCFDSVWVWGNDGMQTADDILQGINRPRHPKSLTVHCFFRHGRKPEAWEKDPEQVMAVWKGQSLAGRKLCGFDRTLPSEYITVNGKVVRNLEGESYARAMATVYAENARKGRGWTADALAIRVAELGGTVTWAADGPDTPELKELEATVKEARAEVKEAAIMKVVNASDLPPEVAVEVKKRGPRTAAEGFGLKRAALTRFYGRVDKEVVEFDDDGRGRAAARLFAHAEAMQKGGYAADSVKHMDQQDYNRASLPRQKHYGLRAVGTNALLKKCGIATVFEKWGTHAGVAGEQAFMKPRIVADFARWAASAEGRQTCTVIGYTVRRDVATNPMQLIGSILRAMGIPLHTKKSNGVSTYYIDRSDYDRMSGMTTPYRRLLASGVILGLRDSDLDDLDSIRDEYAGGMLTPEGADQLEKYLDSLI